MRRDKTLVNYFYNICYQLLVMLVPIFTAPYLARTIGSEGLGIYGYVSTLGSILAMITLLGVYSYGVRETAYCRDNHTALSTLFYELMCCRLVLGTIGTAIVFLLAWLDRKFMLCIILYYPYILANYLDCTWLHVGLEYMKPVVLKNAFCKIITVIGIFLYVKKPEDCWKYILIISLSTLVSNLIVYYNLGQYVGRWGLGELNWRQHLVPSLCFFIPQVASTIYMQVDKLMLRWMNVDINQVGFYDQAEKIVMIPLTFITVISTVLMPKLANQFANDNREEMNHTLIAGARISMLLACPLLVGIVIISRVFIGWYLGSGFELVVPIIRILAVGIVLNTLTGIAANQYLVATNQIMVIVVAYVVCDITNVLINLLLIPRYGSLGAAVASVISLFVALLILYRTMFRQLKMGELIIASARYLMQAILMGLFLYFTTKSMPTSFVTTLTQAFLGMFFYGLMLVVTKDKIIDYIIESIRNVNRK